LVASPSISVSTVSFFVLILISPAKTLDYQSMHPPVTSDDPRFLKQTEALVRRMRRFNAKELAELMSISAPLAELNVARFRNYSKNPEAASLRPALFAFAGDVYDGLEAYRLTAAQIERCQRQLRILSGLYGVLRPLDRIQPYRLEMGTRVDLGVPGYLAGFWRKRITECLNTELVGQSEPIVVNLASEEYFSAIDVKRLKATVVTPVFEDYSAETYKVISFFAKKARGMMCRFALEHRLENPSGLQRFNVDGYAYHAAASDEKRWVFRRRNKELS